MPRAKSHEERFLTLWKQTSSCSILPLSKATGMLYRLRTPVSKCIELKISWGRPNKLQHVVYLFFSFLSPAGYISFPQKKKNNVLFDWLINWKETRTCSPTLAKDVEDSKCKGVLFTVHRTPCINAFIAHRALQVQHGMHLEYSEAGLSFHPLTRASKWWFSVCGALSSAYFSVCGALSSECFSVCGALTSAYYRICCALNMWRRL